MMILKLLFLSFLMGPNDGESQILKASAPFSSQTPYIEPDGREATLKINDNEFLLLSKVKGNTTGSSDYLIEKYNDNLESVFSQPITCNQDEEYLKIHQNTDKTFTIFSNIHNEKGNIAGLKIEKYNISDGSKIESKMAHEFAIKDWVDALGKATVKSSFHNEICASIASSYITPLQYQYNINTSPNNKYNLAYIFDYSQKNLIAKCILFDENSNIKNTFNLPIDNGFTNYGIFPNDNGEVFILNTDKGGRIVAIKYNPSTTKHDFLDIQNASSNRTSLKLSFLNDQEIYIGCLSVNADRLSGIMYFKMNFNENMVEKLNYQPLSTGLKQTVEMLSEGEKEDWKNYELVNFKVNEYEKVILSIEKRSLKGIDYSYNPNNVNNIKNWKEKPLKVNLNGFIIMSFNKDDELLWENFHFKKQENDIITGITNSSYTLNVSDDGRVRVIFPSTNNAAGTNNIINLIEWDELTGNKIREIQLDNKEGMGIQTDYTIWWETKALVMGRKGLLGKKSFLNLYSLGTAY